MSGLSEFRYLSSLVAAPRKFVLTVVFIAFGSIAGLGQTPSCGSLEARIVAQVLKGVSGDELDSASFSDLLAQADGCLHGAGALSAYQRFALTYAAGYGRYYLGIVNGDPAEFDRARSHFTECRHLYDPTFDLPDKYAFSFLMPAWIDVRKFQATGNYDFLDSALQYLQATDFLGCADDALYLRTLVLLYLADGAVTQGEYSRARSLLDRALEALHNLPLPEERQYVPELAKLLWARAALLERIGASGSGLSDNDILESVGDIRQTGESCANSLLCIDCLLRQGAALRSNLHEALLRGAPVQPSDGCLTGDNGCSGYEVFQSISAFMLGNIPTVGTSPEAILWRDWARFLRYYRASVPNLGAGGGALAGLFGAEISGNDWRNEALERLRNYGALLSDLLACGAHGGVDAADFPRDGKLHVGELLDLANGTSSEEAGLIALALGKASNMGCLYQRAEDIFAHADGAGGNAEVERLVRLACAHAKGGAFGPVPGLDAVENRLAAIPDAGLDQAHRVEKYYCLGTIHQFAHGWDGTAQQYFDAVDELDPRSAYMLHYVSHPAAPNLPPLQRALWQTRDLIQRGFAVKWLENRLSAVVGGLPATPGMTADLLADDSNARWDILSPLLSEANLARKFYIDLYTRLSEYSYALAPLPNIPLPWWGRRPVQALTGPRELNLQSEIPVRVSVEGGGVDNLQLWVLDGESVVYSSENYRGEEFSVTTGNKCRIIVSGPGLWPREVDTVFVSPHQVLNVQLLPCLSATESTRIHLGKGKYVVWMQGDEVLMYDPAAHAYSFGNGNSGESLVLAQENDTLYSEIIKFDKLSDGRYAFLDAGRNSIYLASSEHLRSGGPYVALDLRKECNIVSAVDMAVSGNDIYLVDGSESKIVKYSLDSGTFAQIYRGGEDFIPTKVFVERAFGRVWAVDPVHGQVRVLNNGEWDELPGFSAARSNGMAIPWRVFFLKNWGYVGIEDLSSGTVHLFLPVGEYVGHLDLSFGRPVLLSVSQDGGGNLRVSTGKELWTVSMQANSGCRNFRLAGRYSQLGAAARIWGGWLDCAH